MENKIRIASLDDIDVAAQSFVNLMGQKKIFAFYGKMGAGKTTFIKAICKQLGVRDTVCSPTFAIINEYGYGNGQRIFHFDFYRINKEEEAYDFGYEDYFYSGSICFIEWPELIRNLIPGDAVEVTISQDADGEGRTVSVSSK